MYYSILLAHLPPKLDEGDLIRCLDEEVSDLILSLDILHTNISYRNSLSHEIMTKFDVLPGW